jgi:AcrR family transcriptional regulator
MNVHFCQLLFIGGLARLVSMPYLKKCPSQPEPIDCRILTAALDLFVENGYHNVSIHEVQKRAQVSIGSIYNHFGGKEGVAQALYKHILNEVDELVDAVMAEYPTPWQQCEAIIQQLFGYTETHRNIIAFAFHAKHTEFISEEPLACRSAPFTKMRQIVRQGIDNGDFVALDPWVITSSIFGGAIRMIQLRVDGVIENPLPEYAPQLLQTIRAGVLQNGGCQQAATVG